MILKDIHIGYYVREIRDGVRFLSVGQGPLVKVMPRAHTGASFAVLANMQAPFEEAPSVVSTVARRALVILVAHSLSQLGHELRYHTGRRLPAGSSTEWEDEVASYRLERRYVTQAFEQARAW